MQDKTNSVVHCQKCNIKQVDGVFYWSHGNKPATEDEVKNKVCLPTLGKGVSAPCLNGVSEDKNMFIN